VVALDGFAALPARQPPATEVTNRLLGFLMSGQVQPGERIPSERRLTELLGVGRSTVREGIKSLSLLGLVEVRQGDGTYLKHPDSNFLPQVIEWGLLLGEPDLRDLIEARSHIECVLAGLAAERATPADVRALEALLAAMAAAGDDVEAYVEADISLHLRVAEASGNRVLSDLVVRIRSLLQVWASRVLAHAGETSTSLEMHRPIVAAVAAQDPAAARAAMAAHMQRAGRRLNAALDAG
jgi:GntR family transcriptional regulator, transcriptional repressor for pyruvate dehydrogenase complex